MSIANHLRFEFGKKLPVVLQTEAAECGLACLSMVASFYQYKTDLAELRREHAISLKGATLADLIRIAEQLQLATRPLKLDLDELRKLKRPCILHWNFNHFVVLQNVSSKTITVHDPASGVRKLDWDEVSASFTGVALELWPNDKFERKTAQKQTSLRQLLGRVSGVWPALSQVLVLAIALELFMLVSPFFLQWVVDQAIVSADRDLLTTLALGFALLLLMRVAIGSVRSWALMYLGTTLNIQWRANVFAHLLRLPVEYFQKRHIGDIQSRFGSIDHVQSTLTTSFVETILDGVMSIVTLGMMYVFSPLLASIAVGTMIAYAIARWAWYSSFRAATQEQIVFAAKQESHFLESIRGARTIKLFQRENQRRTTWLGLLVDQINSGLKTQRLQLVYGAFSSLLTNLEGIVIIWIGARLVLDGHFSVGALMAFKAYNDQFSNRLSALVDKLLQLQLLKMHGERLADIVLTEPEPSSSETFYHDNHRSSDIAVAHLSFRYSEHEPWVLQDIHFGIRAGESVALIGVSGCGKSTLLNALLGVLKPATGTIHVGGMDIGRIGTNALRTMVGTVLQDDALFAGSIADNICFFDPHPDREWIVECARLAAVHDEIAVMPMNYNSLVGDMGTVLSGGQKQRVLLARALYKRPKILFLDEATSHLDIERERQVNAAIKALNITRLIVAHRPETIASADRVIALANGRIVSDISTKCLATMMTNQPAASLHVPQQEPVPIPN